MKKKTLKDDYHNSCNIYSFLHPLQPEKNKIILLTLIHQHTKQSITKQGKVEKRGPGYEIQELAGPSLNKPLYISK